MNTDNKAEKTFAKVKVLFWPPIYLKCGNSFFLTKSSGGYATRRSIMKSNFDDIVYLDEFRLTDASAMLAADHDSEHRKRFEFPPDFVPSLEHSLNVIQGWIDDRKLGTRYTYAVRDTDSECLVGGCEIRPKENEKEIAHLSYWTHPGYRRRGIATRAVTIACKIAAEFGITRLEILVDKDNTASRRVAVKSGFIQSSDRDGRACYYWNPP